MGTSLTVSGRLSSTIVRDEQAPVLDVDVDDVRELVKEASCLPFTSCAAVVYILLNLD
jgi:hypothetical protein